MPYSVRNLTFAHVSNQKILRKIAKRVVINRHSTSKTDKTGPDSVRFRVGRYTYYMVHPEHPSRLNVFSSLPFIQSPTQPIIAIIVISPNPKEKQNEAAAGYNCSSRTHSQPVHRITSHITHQHSKTPSSSSSSSSSQISPNHSQPNPQPHHNSVQLCVHFHSKTPEAKASCVSYCAIPSERTRPVSSPGRATPSTQAWAG